MEHGRRVAGLSEPLADELGLLCRLLDLLAPRDEGRLAAPDLPCRDEAASAGEGKHAEGPREDDALARGRRELPRPCGEAEAALRAGAEPGVQGRGRGSRQGLARLPMD